VVTVSRFFMHNGVPCAVYKLACGIEFYVHNDTTYFLDVAIADLEKERLMNEDSCDEEMLESDTDDDFSYFFL
jgi:hypothetical protein